MDDQRLIDIEIKIAHQEFLMSELNQVIAKQQATIDELQKSLKGFLKRYQELNGDEGAGIPVSQKPPHY
jgi:SlyX protein